MKNNKPRSPREANPKENSSSAMGQPAVPAGTQVAMVVRQFSPHGGLELYAYQVVKGLLDRGVRVTVICEEDLSGMTHPLLTVRFFEKTPHGLPKWKRIEHHFAAATKAVAEFGPFDLVHSQHLPVRGADVVTFHNHTAQRLSDVGQVWEQSLNRAKVEFVRAYKLRDRYDRLLCKEAAALVFPSAACRDDFAQRYDLAHFNARASLVVAQAGSTLANDPPSLLTGENLADRALALSPFTFLFVGKGFRKKGLDILLKACSILHRRGRIFKLNIAGLKAKAIDRGRLALMRLSDRVHYLGFQKDMNAVYSKASVIVLPSRIEPFGMAPLQAMLRGIVPIVSAVSGVAEVLTDEQDSLILNDHLDAVELAEHMERLMSDLEFTRKLSQNAIETARRCTWDQTVEATLDAYRAALVNRAG